MANKKYNDVEVASLATDLILGSDCAMVFTDRGTIMVGKQMDLAVCVASGFVLDNDILKVFEVALEIIKEHGDDFMEYVKKNIE